MRLGSSAIPSGTVPMRPFAERFSTWRSVNRPGTGAGISPDIKLSATERMRSSVALKKVVGMVPFSAFPDNSTWRRCCMRPRSGTNVPVNCTFGNTRLMTLEIVGDATVDAPKEESLVELVPVFVLELSVVLVVAKPMHMTPFHEQGVSSK